MQVTVAAYLLQFGFRLNFSLVSCFKMVLDVPVIDWHRVEEHNMQLLADDFKNTKWKMCFDFGFCIQTEDTRVFAVFHNTALMNGTQIMPQDFQKLH